MADPIRIFIGTEEKTEIARKVLQCSILRRTKQNVLFTPMIGPEWEYDTSKISQGTGFSLRRWMIPAFCKWEGRAIYMDADQLVFGDVNELWNKPTEIPKAGCAAWMTYQVSKFSVKIPHPNSSVMVLDCAAAKEQEFFDIERLLRYLTRHTTKEAYAKVMYPTWMKPDPMAIANEWNHLNRYVKNGTKLLHYTKEPEQPFYRPEHELAYLWQEELTVAIKQGWITKAEFEYALSKWNVKEDWRNTNGLHPFYRKYLPLFDEQTTT